MTRPRTTLVALAAVLATAAAGGLGEAQADSTSSTTTATPNTIVVNGTDSIDAVSGATSAEDQATYQTALGDAITNAQAKATFIASQIGATLGAITNVTETSDSSELCQGPILEPQAAKTTTTSGGSSRHKKAHALRAHRADVVVDSTCTIEADVTVTYAMTPA